MNTRRLRLRRVLSEFLFLWPSKRPENVFETAIIFTVLCGKRVFVTHDTKQPSSSSERVDGRFEKQIPDDQSRFHGLLTTHPYFFLSRNYKNKYKKRVQPIVAFVGCGARRWFGFRAAHVFSKFTVFKGERVHDKSQHIWCIAG